MINERKHKCLFQNDLSYKKRGRSSAVSKDASKGSWSSSSVAYQKSFDKNLRWAFNFFSVRANLTVLKDAPTHSLTLSSLTDTASNFFSTAAQDLSREPLRHCNKKITWKSFLPKLVTLIRYFRLSVLSKEPGSVSWLVTFSGIFFHFPDLYTTRIRVWSESKCCLLSSVGVLFAVWL